MPHFPDIFGSLEKAAAGLGNWVEQASEIAVNSSVFIPACVAFFLARLWGIAYHLLRHGRKLSSDKHG